MKQDSLSSLIHSNAADSVATADGLAVARVVIEQAAREGVKAAIAGGLAMHLYGYVRATQDVDLLASNVLKLEARQQLSFGGESYLVKLGDKQIIVDVIVRNDFFRAFYEAALADAGQTADGLPLLTPEWLVILKYLAGRSKDQLDLLWLLQEPDLVNRQLVQVHLTAVMGRMGAQVALRGLEDFYLRAALMRAGDENGETRS